MATETVAQAPQNLFEDLSCELASVIGILNLLAESLEHGSADAAYGMLSLLHAAKAKVDAAIPGATS